MNRLEEILKNCAYVVENAQHVKIEEQEINNIIEILEREKSTYWLSSNPFGILDWPTQQLINFLLILEAMDFSFWGTPKWTIETNKKEEIDGSFALLYVLQKVMREKGHIDFTKISFEEYKKMVRGNVEIPLVKERYQNAYEASKIVNEKMNGNFYEQIKKINTDTELFSFIVDNFPFFEDKRTYKGKIIPFYKLGQLLTADILHILEEKEKIKVDYSHLVGCADYKIPQSLRNLNVLIYDKELANIVDQQKEIPKNSIYEVEIRAGTLIAIDKIKQKMANSYRAIEINDLLWSIGQKCENKKPYHRTRTTSY